MEKEPPIYLQTCTDCGRPALTLDDQNQARCGEHADVFIPAEDAPRDDGGDEDAW